MIVSQSALLGLALATLISLAAPVAILLVCRKRMILLWRNVALGAGTFIIFALVLEGGMHFYFLKYNAQTAAWLGSHVWAFTAYAAGAAALFEETGRFLTLRFFAKRAGNPGTAVAYGIGHGGAEAIIVGAFAQAQSIVLAMLLNAGKFDTALAGKAPPEMIAKLRDTLVHLDLATALLGGMERIWALLLQIALSLLVWRAVERREWRWLFAAFALHAGIDSFGALYQKGAVSLVVTEGLVTVVGLALLIFFVVKLPRKGAPA